MSFLTRSALLAGSSLKNGAKVSVSSAVSMEDCEISDDNVMKNESEKFREKDYSIIGTLSAVMTTRDVSFRGCQLRIALRPSHLRIKDESDSVD